MIVVWLFSVAVVVMTTILAVGNTEESFPSLLYSEVVPPEQRCN